MCGIIGYIGKKDSALLLIEGLKKLEYRGYDSAGISIKQGKKIKVIKKKGKIEELEKQKDLENFKGMIGIAHTRWATHGEPNECNAHPHLDCKKQIAIAHNGIIENYQALKKLLEKEGHKIISDTDSEIIAHLIEKFYKNNLEKAVQKAVKLIEGAYGLVIIHKDEDKIIAVKKSSPLIIGVGDNEMFIASDVPAILNHTKRVIYLHDNEIAIIDKNNYVIKNINGNKVDKKIEEIKYNVAEIEKKGFKHFMLKEIMEQSESLANTIRGRIKNRRIRKDRKRKIGLLW